MIAPLQTPSARGRLKTTTAGQVVFLPAGTNYELHLTASGVIDALKLDHPIEALIRVQARKVWTVPSGGQFIQPIFGEPRIIQGRVRWLDEAMLIVHAGTDFVVTLPASSAAIDLAHGPIECGALVNVTVLPGATLEIASA